MTVKPRLAILKQQLMKQLHKKEAKFFNRLGLVVAGILLAVMSVVWPATQVQADVFDEQIRSLEQEIQKFQDQAGKLRAEANTLQNRIASLQAERSSIQKQIELNEAELQRLNEEIKQTEVRLENQKILLSGNLRAMYLESTISPLEMVASSKSISDFIDKQEYRNKIREQVQRNMANIRDLRKQLDEKKLAVERNINDQKSQREALANKESEQAQILAQTQGQEAAYQELTKQRDAQIADLRAQQAAAYASIEGGTSSVGGIIEYRNRSTSSCGGGYSYCWAAWDQWVPDDWGLHLARECVHYAADTLARRGYYIPYNLFAGGRGSAYQWRSTAVGSGAATLGGPARDAVVYMPVGDVGHVGIVDEVYGDGWIRISQMNFPFGGHFSTMDLKVTPNLEFYHFKR